MVRALASTVCLVDRVHGRPEYVRPAAPVPPSYKWEEGWREARPADALDRGAWWSVFSDPPLDALMRQVEISNQNVAAAEAAFRNTAEAVAAARAGFFPTVDVNASATRARTGISRGSGAGVTDGSGRIGNAFRATGRQLDPRFVGACSAECDRCGSDRAGQRRRSCRGAPRGAGATGDGLYDYPGTRRAAPAGRCVRESLLEVSADHPEPVQCRARLRRRRGTGAHDSRKHASPRDRGGDPAGPARKRDCRADRQAAIGAEHRAGAGTAGPAGNPGGAAVGFARASAGYAAAERRMPPPMPRSASPRRRFIPISNCRANTGSPRPRSPGWCRLRACCGRSGRH